jgi:hypothetical protein
MDGGSRGFQKPSYEDMFRLVSAVVLDAPLSRDAATDASRVLEALRTGHTFSVVRAMVRPASLGSATAGGSVVRMGTPPQPRGRPRFRGACRRHRRA